MKVLVLASGGLDSSVLVTFYKRLGYDVKLMFFNYGQANVKQEYTSLAKVMEDNKIKSENLYEMSISVPWSDSSTLNGRGSAYVEMRNLIFASYALSLCDKESIDVLALGYILTETEYKDTSEQFIKDLRDLASHALSVRVEVPFYDMWKVEVARLGLQMGVDITATFSCNTPVDGFPCGKCDDCKDMAYVHKCLAQGGKP